MSRVIAAVALAALLLPAGAHAAAKAKPAAAPAKAG